MTEGPDLLLESANLYVSGLEIRAASMLLITHEIDMVRLDWTSIVAGVMVLQSLFLDSSWNWKTLEIF